MQVMNYSRCIESVGYAHVLSVTLYFVAVYSRGFEASNLEHVSRFMLLTIVAFRAFLINHTLKNENCSGNSHIFFPLRTHQVKYSKTKSPIKSNLRTFDGT